MCNSGQSSGQIAVYLRTILHPPPPSVKAASALDPDVQGWDRPGRKPGPLPPRSSLAALRSSYRKRTLRVGFIKFVERIVRDVRIRATNQIIRKYNDHFDIDIKIQ